MRKNMLVAALAGMVLLATTVSHAAELKIGGGGSACLGYFAPLVEACQAEAGITMKIKASTPAQGLIELNDGHLDIATAAVSFDIMVKGAARNGITIDPSQFTVREIGSNKTLVFTHKSNKIIKLSKKQLQDIFTGKVVNWKDVGGANEKIIVVWGLATPGQNELFTRQILDGKSVTQKHQEVPDYKGIRDFIAKNPGAIGIDPHGFVSAATNNPKIPLITAPVIVVTKGEPSAEVEKLLQFVKGYN
jgi:phosphate transport system substrate-binding protein